MGWAQTGNGWLALTGGLPDAATPGLAFKSVAGGFLAQSRDAGQVTEAMLKVVTQRAPTPAEMADYALKFSAERVKIFGGCCGSTPAHIRAVAETLRAS